MDPVSMLGVATAVAKLLLAAYSLREDASVAGVLDTSEKAQKAWEKVRGAVDGAKRDPVAWSIAGKLSASLPTGSLPEQDRDAYQAAANNVGNLLAGFATDNDAVLAAARDPEGFPRWAMDHGGNALFALTPERGEGFFRRTLAAAASAFGELAPFSPRFVPSALNQVLDQLDVIVELHLGPMAVGIQDIQQRLARDAAERSAAPRPSWPVVVGPLPALASAFQIRQRLRDAVDRARHAGDGGSPSGVVLTQVLSGGGGVGKSQLAASFAWDSLAAGIDLVVWVAAESIDGIVSAYATAAGLVQAAGATGRSEDVESDAHAFLQWTVSTQQSWLIVLDNITDPQNATRWWPTSHRDSNWTLATTRSRDPQLFGGGRRQVDISTYSEEEAEEYLQARLVGHPALLDGTRALCAAVGHLPLALSHAAAYMLDQRVSCRTYCAMYLDEAERLDAIMPGDPDGHGLDRDGQARTITVALLLAVAAADQCPPVGMARAALDLCSVLDPNGHLEALWSTEAVTNYLAAHRAEAPQEWVPVTAAEARRAVTVLNRFGLITLDEQHLHQAVQIHGLTARAARETNSALADTVWAAADALLDIWPEHDHLPTSPSPSLRSNAAALSTASSRAGDALWSSEGGHPLLWKVGLNLTRAGLYASATAHWLTVLSVAERLLGPDHRATLTARGNLAGTYRQAGRTEDALAIGEQLVNDTERLLGPDHPDTLIAWGNLGMTYRHAGRTERALTIFEQLVSDMERLLGPDHPATLTARGSLATTYLQAGRTDDALTIFEQLVRDTERLLGPDHPATLNARGNLASTYRQAGQAQDALTIFEQLVSDTERLLGPDHPATLIARGNLASTYWQAGRTEDALTIFEQLVSDTERLLGPDHPDTLTARGNLGTTYLQAGRAEDALSIFEQLVSDTERLLGPDHPDTLTTRGNLASTYWQAGQTEDALANFEQLVSDTERLLGPDHPATLTARGNLGTTYWQAGRAEDALSIFEQLVSDTERLLGPDHPDTLTTRGNLASTYWQAGRTEDALTIEEQLVSDMVRLLGPGHPNTLTARGNLGTTYWQAGRPEDALLIFEQLLSDMERLLGPDHPATLTTRGNLASTYWQAGRTEDALTIEEQLVSDTELLLGPDHPDTLTTRGNLASTYMQAGRTEDALTIEARLVSDTERLLGVPHRDLKDPI